MEVICWRFSLKGCHVLETILMIFHAWLGWNVGCFHAEYLYVMLKVNIMGWEHMRAASSILTK